MPIIVLDVQRKMLIPLSMLLKYLEHMQSSSGLTNNGLFETLAIEALVSKYQLAFEKLEHTGQLNVLRKNGACLKR